MIAFGVGCFHFGVRSTMPSPFSPSEYAEEIHKVLSELDVVSDIMIDINPITDPKEKTFSHDGKPPAFRDGIVWFPHITFLDISFCIHLPRRVQARFLDVPEHTLKNTSEDFHVHIRNAYHAPVAIIELINTDEDNPSAAVIVVREYLESNINSQKSHIIFETIGPSPFHADFKLTSESNGTSIAQAPFHVQHNTKRGYDEVVFTYSTEDFSSETGAKSALYAAISDELGLYYRVILQDHAHLRMWEDIEGVTKQLFFYEGKGTVTFKFMNKLKQGRNLSKLANYICNLRSDLIFDENSLRNAYDNIFSSGGYLRQFVDCGMKNRISFPLQEISDLLTFGEQRHSKTMEMAIVLIAAIVGGIVGSLFTFYLTKNEPNIPSNLGLPQTQTSIDNTQPTD